MASDITHVRGRLDELRQTLDEVFRQAGPDYDMSQVALLEGDSAAKVAQIRAMNNEMDDLSRQIEQIHAEQGDPDEFAAMQERLTSLSDVARRPIHPAGGGQSRHTTTMTVGEQFVASDAYLSHRSGDKSTGPLSTLDIGLHDLRAATFLTSAGWAPESARTGRVVEKALRPVQVTDLVSQAATNSAAVVYMEETTATSGAAERAEEGAYPASALALTQRSVTVRSIGTSLPVTDEQLEDVAQAQSYIDGRLGFFVMQRLDGQLLNGDGQAPNILGYLSATGLQTQAKAADPSPDAVHKAMTKIRVTGRAFPSGAVFHPTDWQNIALLRTADGIYVWGSPSEVTPDRIWGLTVAQSDAIAAGTALIGDFSPVMSQLFIRRGLEVQLGFDSGDFLLGRQSVRAGLRGALVVYRGAAYCTVTGL